MTASSAGYSGKPLPVKLGFKPGMAAAFVALPPAFSHLATWADFATVEEAEDWDGQFGSRRFDLIHAFTSSRLELVGGLLRLQAAIKTDGMIWVSWPKRASKVATDLTEDVIRSLALEGDLVDVKVAAIDPVWSGLKLVIRKDRR